MTRPKVPPDQRQRTAQACESCKRRKQKCNGLCPCNTCEKRKFTCTYTEKDAASPPEGVPAAKKRMNEIGVADYDPATPRVNDGSTSQDKLNGSSSSATYSTQIAASSSFEGPRLSFSASDVEAPAEVSIQRHEKPPKPRDEGSSMEAAARSLQQFAASVEEHPNAQFMSRGTTNSGQDEEAVVYSQTRMLQDPTGRLLYVGDSASLSFLQLLRMMVENVVGPSPFTNDPRRHKIMESQFSLPSNSRGTHLLPDKRTAYVLVDSFFVNTQGFLQVFDRQTFLAALDCCYSDPLSTEPPWLCLLNLVFAIGLMLATPRAGTSEASTIDKLRSEHLDRAEIFYLNAKSLNDPLTGFEDADFWSVQALLLMAVYMLAKSKRNTAFALLGMAVRSAYAMGLHREETLGIFNPEEQSARRNLWRSLFVVDRFLSCSLGRPTAISEEDCSGDTLHPSDPDENSDVFGFNSAYPSSSNFTSSALEAAVRSCSVIGTILKRVYQERKISTRLAQELADVCKLWPKALAPMLHWRQAASASPGQGIAILHVNLFYCHSIVLLTRPFFLFILNAETQKEMAHSSTGIRPGRNYTKMEKFGEACVIASTHTIVLVQNAFEAGYLPRRNPVVIYFLFAAALVLLSNEFAVLYVNMAADQCIRNAISIMAYCAETDPQATRLLYILSTFRDVVAQQREKRRRLQQETAQATLVTASSQQLYTPADTRVSMQMLSPLQMNRQLPPQADKQVPVDALPEDKNGSSLGNLHGEGVQSPVQETEKFASHIPFANLNSFPSPTTVFQPPNPTDRTRSSTRDAAQPAASTPLVLANEISPLNTATPLPSTEQHTGRSLSLSNLLDLSAFDNARLPSIHSEESSGGDDQIDFDALWAWPSNTPAVGTPRLTGDVQGISDSAIPLFGVMDT